MSVCYDEDSHVNGQQIELAISGTGEVVKLFFTEYHIEYWLSQEPASDGIVRVNRLEWGGGVP